MQLSYKKRAGQSFHRPIVPLYYIEDCRISIMCSALKEISVLTPSMHKMTKRVGERQQSYFSKIDLIM